MKKGFIRALWGTYDANQRHFMHRGKINRDIKLSMHNKYLPPYVTFVFGRDNYTQLIDEGFKDCILADEKPIVWDMNTEQFRHKLEALKLGMEIFDEIVYTDIDTLPIKAIPDNFWPTLANKSSIQAILRMYHRKRCFWRKTDCRKTPCAAFIYIRDKKIPIDLIKMWEDMGRPWSEEIVLMKYMDDISGGWKGEEFYWNNFEPDFFNLISNSGQSNKKLLQSKNVCFEHFNLRTVIALLDQIDHKLKLSYECFSHERNI